MILKAIKSVAIRTAVALVASASISLPLMITYLPYEVPNLVKGTILLLVFVMAAIILSSTPDWTNRLSHKNPVKVDHEELQAAVNTAVGIAISFVLYIILYKIDEISPHPFSRNIINFLSLAAFTISVLMPISITICRIFYWRKWVRYYIKVKRKC